MLPAFAWTPPAHPDSVQRAALALALGQQLVSETETEQWLCDGFRVPDEAWGRFRDPKAVEDYSVADTLSVGSSVTSNFWVVPVENVEPVLAALDACVIKALPQGLDPQPDDSAALGVWRHPGSAQALVGCVAFGDWAAELDSHFDGQEILASATPVLFGGNDNGVHNLLETFEDDGEEVESETLELLWAVVHPDIREQTWEDWKQTAETALGPWKPSASRKPVP